MTRPIRLVQVTCHQRLQVIAASMVSRQEAPSACPALPRQDHPPSITMNASEIANSPTRAGISGTPS